MLLTHVGGAACRVELNAISQEEEANLVEEVMALKGILGFQSSAPQTVLVQVS